MSAFRPLFVLALGLAVSPACHGDKAGTDGDSPYQSVLSVYPPVGGQGQSLDVSIDATVSTFEYGATAVDFGDGISVESTTVDDGWGASARILVDPDAELGLRDVVVTVDGSEKTLTDSFEVIAQSFSVDPGSAKMGESVDVEILGHNTDWVSGLTWPFFGDDVDVTEFTVLSETLATASLVVSPDAAPGYRNVTMDNGGGDLVVLYDGFKIDRVALAATFDPVEAEQGDTVEFTIVARGTDFLADTPDLTFFDRYGENPDIVVDSLTVLDAENLYGQMTLSNAAALGGRDVLVGTGDEGVTIPDAFEVVSGGWDLEEVAIALRFYVSRSVDNTTGDIEERIVAFCEFYIPLDPPCPSGGGGSGSGSKDSAEPYDKNGYEMGTGSGGGGSEEDCPTETTIGAGDYVWLESDINTITLERYEDTSSGAVYYINTDLTMDDYVPDNWYDLHTQGQEDGIGEYLLEDVQPTVPADWEWLSPPLYNNYTHNRAEDFVFTWTPAQTYPDAWFYFWIWDRNNWGPFAEEGYAGYLQAIPWDDGEHAMEADYMSLLAPGGVPVTAYSIIQGPEFGLPESIYQDNQAVSYILYSMYMVVE